MSKCRVKKEAGFTLIELLVVIFIISLILGSITINYLSGQKRYDVSRTLQKMTANLRQTQNMALSGKTQGAIIPTGYGLYTQSAVQYVIFYNTDNAKSFNAGSIIIEIFSLPADVVLAPVGESIFFVPPDPTTYINDVNSGWRVFTIKSGDYGRNITVFSSGRIDIN